MNAVLRAFELPTFTDLDEALECAENNYGAKGVKFVGKCHQAMDEAEIRANDALHAKYSA